MSDKPNVCRWCLAYVGPESTPHRHGTTVEPSPFIVVEDEPGTVRHTTIGGDGAVARLRKRDARARRQT